MDYKDIEGIPYDTIFKLLELKKLIDEFYSSLQKFQLSTYEISLLSGETGLRARLINWMVSKILVNLKSVLGHSKWITDRFGKYVDSIFNN